MAVTDVLKEYVGELVIGKGMVKEALGVLPVHYGKASEVAYVTYDEALKKKVITVTEVSEGGSVPQLRLINKGDQRVLILDGEQLVGAKQNRILNTTILVEANDTLIIPVTCVEQGRWSYSQGRYAGNRDMGDSRHQMVATERAMKAQAVSANLAASAGYTGDQNGTWRRLDDRMHDIGVDSPTSAMEDMYESVEDKLKAFLEALAIDMFDESESIVGAVFTIEGEILGMDAFDKHSTTERVWEKLLNSYAIEVLRARKEGDVNTGRAEAFLQSVVGAEMNIFSPPGLGKDVRLQSDVVVGSGLVVDDQVVHAYAFNTQGQDDAGSEGPRSTMTSFGTRLRQTRR
jgi:hypothetical protein